MLGVLDGLEDIEWAALTHAYGTAEDVPGLIRDLRSSNAEVRGEAFYELYGNIFHQGTRYEASAYAVPFLLELLADPVTPDRDQIIGLLACLAIGDGYSFVTTGFPVEDMRALVARISEPDRQRWRQQLKDWHASSGDSGRPRQPFPLSGAEGRALDVCDEMRTYDAVGDGVELLVGLLDDAEAEVAGQAVYALAWFPEQASAIVPALMRLATDNQAPTALASAALVALGLVAPRGDRTFDGLLQTRLGGGDPDLRWAAAVAWAHLAGSALPEAAVAELRTWAADYGDGSPRTIWEVSQPDLALRMLDHVAARVAGQIRARLVDLELAKPPKSNWHNHFNVVLDRAFPSMDQDHGLPFEELTPAQQAVVLWLAGRPEVFGSSGPDGPLRQHGLPTTAEALRGYAGLELSA